MTTPHQDNYHPANPLIRTNTCIVGSCPDTNSKSNPHYIKSHKQNNLIYTCMVILITKISRLGEIPIASIQFVGIVDPKMVFFSFEKVAKKCRKTSVFPIWRSRQRRLATLAITAKRNDDNSCDLTQQCK